MKWIKASERLPEGKSHVATIWRVIGHIQPLLIGVYRKDKDGLFLRTPLGGESGRLVWSALEWLDESIPASAVEEAKALYPYPDESEYEKQTLLVKKSTINIQRSAHITCAGMYTDTIDKLKAENSKMRLALKSVLQRCATSGEDYGQAIYDISEMSYEAIRIDELYK